MCSQRVTRKTRKASATSKRGDSTSARRQRKASASAAEKSAEHRLRAVLDAASNGIVAVDNIGIVTAANAAAAEMLERDVAAMHGMPIARVFVYGGGHPQAGMVLPIAEHINNGPYHAEIVVPLQRTDGSSFEASLTIAPILIGRKSDGVVITVRDVTERRRVAAEQRIASALFDASADGLAVTDARGRVVKANPAFLRIARVSHSNAVGASLFDVMAMDDHGRREVQSAFDKNTDAAVELWHLDAARQRRALRVGVSPIRDEQGSLERIAVFVSDITERKLEEEKVLRRANYDQLTDLPNRTLFNERLQRLVIEGRRGKTNVGLMFIDLDGFKAINDTLGHDAGDLLLKQTAARLVKSVREADTVARLGGDEFTVIMPLLDTLEGATLVASRILAALTRPFDLNGREGRVSASIGISIYPGQADSAENLLQNADVAMYHAKRQGKANYQIWRSELNGNYAAGS